MLQAVGGNIMTSSPISDLNPIFSAARCQLELHSKGQNYSTSIDLYCEGSKVCSQNTEIIPDHLMKSVCH
jgi:xanthine dehydrogenase iron-sulfur cluster and FAD-binding subunit A